MSYNPNWVSKPIDSLLDILKDKNISVDTLKKELNFSESDFKKFIEGGIKIDVNISLELERILKVSSKFWLKRQEMYDFRIKAIEESEKEIWLKSLPINELFERGFMCKTKDLYSQCLDFFNVQNIFDWKLNYVVNSNLAYRKNNTFDTLQSSVITWQRIGELQANKFKAEKFNSEKFLNYLDNEIKSLTRIKNPNVFIPKLFEYCLDCGVHLSVVRSLKKCPVYGVTKFLTNKSPLIILSFRYLADDQFWFTFYHEAGHILLHSEKMQSYVSGVENVCNEEDEKDANSFAQEMLIPLQLRKNFSEIKSNKRKIIELSKEANISPGILIGQMQHSNVISKSHLNSYKRYYKKEEINNAVESAIELLSSK